MTACGVNSGRLTTRGSTPLPTAAEGTRCKAPSPAALATEDLAGEPVSATLTTAPGNGAPIGGIKVVADNGWFAARPSGTEDVYKIYAESFRSESHLGRYSNRL